MSLQKRRQDGLDALRVALPTLLYVQPNMAGNLGLYVPGAKGFLYVVPWRSDGTMDNDGTGDVFCLELDLGPTLCHVVKTNVPLHDIPRQARKLVREYASDLESRATSLRELVYGLEPDGNGEVDEG